MNDYKLFGIYITLLLVTVSSVFAGQGGTSFRVDLEPTSLSNQYEGRPASFNIKITNLNNICRINCKINVDGSGSQGSYTIHSKDYEDCSNPPCNIEMVSKSITVPSDKKGSYLVPIDVRCDEDPAGLYCLAADWDEKLTSLQVNYNYCGDNHADSGFEDCDVNDLNGKTCKSIKGSDYDGTPKCSNCKFDTSTCNRCGDGKLAGNEKCDEGSNNGRQCTPAYESTCSYCSNSCQTVSLKGGSCGDSNKDSAENCNNCPQDAGCRDTEQCSSSYKCVNVVNDDNNCGSIGHKCDTIDKMSSTGESSCSSDYSKAIQVQQITKEQCKYKTCEKVVTNKNIETDCLEKGKYCQEGNCGCSDGYDVCEPLKSCVEKKGVELNQQCKCDFQCKEGFCDETSNQCVKGLNVKISSSNSALSVGEETTISLSVSNPLTKDVEADITLSLGDGVELVEVLSGDQCAGSQCKLDKTTIPAGGKKDVTVRIKANSATTSLMNALVNYQLGSKKKDLKDKTSVIITECGNGKVEGGETSSTCCVDAGCPADDRFYSFSCNDKTKSCNKSLHSYYVYGGVGAVVLIILILFTLGRLVNYSKKHREEKNKRKNEEAEEEKQREKIRTQLNIIKKAINVDKPLSINTVKSKLKNLGIKSIDEDILSDEYNDFLDKLEEQKKEEQKKELEHEKKKDDEKKQKKSEDDKKEEKEPKKKHCHKCGVEAKGSGKFCHKCGTSLKR